MSVELSGFNFNPQYTLFYTDEGPRQRVRCSCGWATEAAAPADMAIRAARAHQRDQHPGVQQWAAIRPVGAHVHADWKANA